MVACAKHAVGNLQKACGKDARGWLWAATQAQQTEDWEKLLRGEFGAGAGGGKKKKAKKCPTQVKNWIEKRKKTLVPAFFEPGTITFGRSSSSLAESWNAQLAPARCRHGAACILAVLKLISTAFLKRQQELADPNHDVHTVSEKNKKKLQKATERAVKKHEVRVHSHLARCAKARVAGLTVEIAPEKASCTCTAWKTAAKAWPCCHLLALCSKVGQDATVYVSAFFRQAGALQFYKNGGPPLLKAAEFLPKAGKIHAPAFIKRRGRPRKDKRIQSDGEKNEKKEQNKKKDKKNDKPAKRVFTCSCCGQKGHTKVKCKEERPRDAPPAPGTQPPAKRARQ